MKLQELLVSIKEDNYNIEEALNVKKYLPIDVKKAIAQGIIFECASEEFGAIKIDYVQKYIAYVRHMITTHTDLEYTDEDYDTICSAEYKDGTLLDAIFECFERDAEEFEMILDLVLEDYMQNFSVEYTIARFVNEFGATIKGFADKVNGLDVEKIIPKDLDVQKLNGFLNKYIK